MQCRAKFHVDFSETEGNFALYCTISFTFPSTQIEGNTTFFLVLIDLGPACIEGKKIPLDRSVMSTLFPMVYIATSTIIIIRGVSLHACMLHIMWHCT